MIVKLRSFFTNAKREKTYILVIALVVLLGGLGIITEAEVALWTTAAVATVALLFAMLFATSNLRLAVYGLVAALGPLLTWYSIGTGAQWTAIIAFFGSALAIGKAATKTYTVIDETGELIQHDWSENTE